MERTPRSARNNEIIDRTSGSKGREGYKLVAEVISSAEGKKSESESGISDLVSARIIMRLLIVTKTTEIFKLPLCFLTGL